MSRIETLFLSGQAGRIECMLKHAAPAATDDPPSAGAAIICHPHPLFGGTLHNKVVHSAAEAIVRRGIPTLRFNFRGAGGSGGRHDHGRGEQEDLRLVLDHTASRYPGRPLLIGGYSFGAFVGLRVGCTDDRVTTLLGIGLPVGLYDFGFLAECVKPLSLIQGERDPFGPIGLLMTMAAALPGGCRVLTVPGADHGFNGRLNELADRVSAALPGEILDPATGRVPGACPDTRTGS